MAGIFSNLDSNALLINGTADHAHMLFNLSRTHSLADVVKEVKRSSNSKAKEFVPEFYWQSNYAAFSVSHSGIKKVKNYIEHQEAHHQSMSFQDELRTLLKRHEVESEEDYVWD